MNPNPWVMTVHRDRPVEIDEAEVRRALGLFLHPGHTVQIQSLPTGKWKLLPGSDLDLIVKAVAELSDGAGTYFSLNPLRTGLEKASKNSDVMERRWLLIDPDSRKPESVGKNASTTDEEKHASQVVTEQIREFLRGRDWPDPIYVDSGNNWQLLYRIDLPNDKLSAQLVSRCLRNLAKRFDTPDVQVDTTVHDARRICKIPGTMTRKGQNVPERPWRMARLMSVPMSLDMPVSLELLKALAEIGPPPKDDGPKGGTEEEHAPDEAGTPPPGPDPWKIEVGKGPTGYEWGNSAIEREVGRVATCTDFRNNTLHDAAVNAGQVVKHSGYTEAEVRVLLYKAGEVCGLGTDGDPGEIRRAIENGFTWGLEHPREPKDNGTGHGKGKKQTGGKGANQTATEAEDKPLTDDELVEFGNEIDWEHVDWLWENRIARSFISIFAGRTGVGKSFVALDIIARMTTGSLLPDSECECASVNRALIISEDPTSQVLIPRLTELGARLDYIAFMKWKAMMQYHLHDTSLLHRAWVKAHRPGLVMIDPPTSFLGDIDEHKNSAVRQVIMSLVNWMKSLDDPPAIIFITHVNKGGKGVDAISRVIGSVAWMTTARIGHVFAPDPEDPGRVLFLSSKNNLGPLAKGLAYRVVSTHRFAKVEWLGETATTADEAMNQEVKKPKQMAAEEWLKKIFREKREWSSDEFWASSRQHGCTRRDIDGARARLKGIQCRRDVFEDGSTHWTWWVPHNWPHLQPERDPEPEYE